MANRISAALFAGLILVVGSAASFAESVTVTLPPGAEVTIRHVGGKDSPLVRVESNGVVVEANRLVLRSAGGRAWDGSPEMVAVESGIRISSGEKTFQFTSMHLFGGHTHSK